MPTEENPLWIQRKCRVICFNRLKIMNCGLRFGSAGGVQVPSFCYYSGLDKISNHVYDSNCTNTGCFILVDNACFCASTARVRRRLCYRGSKPESGFSRPQYPERISRLSSNEKRHTKAKASNGDQRIILVLNQPGFDRRNPNLLAN